MKKKVISFLVVFSFVLSTVGCNTAKSDLAPKSPMEEVKENNNLSPVSQSKSLFDVINTNFAAAEVDKNYEAPVFEVEENHVFEFEACEKACYDCSNVFKVYTRLDEKYPFSRAHVYYEDNKIYVEPGQVVTFNDFSDPDEDSIITSGSDLDTTGTWGAFNKLYLVQEKDLETGEDLSTPIVTPFATKHPLDAPVVHQGVTSGNLYQLSWEPIKGADKYVVCSKLSDDSYSYEVFTENTSVTIDEFKTQKWKEELMSAVRQDLINADYAIDKKEGLHFDMNGMLWDSGSEIDDEFIVVAINSSGEYSAISNILSVKDIADSIVYSVDRGTTKEVTLNTAMDLPTHYEVEMIDGSKKKMLIDYREMEAFYDSPDDKSFYIRPHIFNTDLMGFLMQVNGMSFNELKDSIEPVRERQAELNVSNGSQELDVVLPSAPTKEDSDDDITAREHAEELNVQTSESNEPEEPADEEPVVVEEEPIEEEPVVNEEPTETEQEEPTEQQEVAKPTSSGDEIDESKIITTPEGFTTYDLYLETVADVESKLDDVGNFEELVYANNKLEAWVSFCLLANENVIPVPICVFPEASDEEYLARTFVEAYRQNPSSGMISKSGFSYDYESLVVEYCEDWDTRHSKMKEEISKANDLASTLVDSSMSELDKIIAINEYIRENASYDYDSCATDVDMSNLSEAFIDAHTPYGILINNYGVCESYSEAFALIGRLAGLDVIIETGTLDGGGHEWNRVKIDGNWYIVDITNNDKDQCPNALLNVTDEQAKGTLTPDGTAFMADLTATDDSKEYYKINNKSASSSSEASDIIISQLKSNEYANVRLPVGTSENEIASILQSVVDARGEKFSEIYYIANVLGVKK